MFATIFPFSEVVPRILGAVCFGFYGTDHLHFFLFYSRTTGTNKHVSVILVLSFIDIVVCYSFKQFARSMASESAGSSVGGRLDSSPSDGSESAAATPS